MPDPQDTPPNTPAVAEKPAPKGKGSEKTNAERIKGAVDSMALGQARWKLHAGADKNMNFAPNLKGVIESVASLNKLKLSLETALPEKKTEIGKICKDLENSLQVQVSEWEKGQVSQANWEAAIAKARGEIEKLPGVDKVKLDKLKENKEVTANFEALKTEEFNKATAMAARALETQREANWQTITLMISGHAFLSNEKAKQSLLSSLWSALGGNADEKYRKGSIRPLDDEDERPEIDNSIPNVDASVGIGRTKAKKYSANFYEDDTGSIVHISENGTTPAPAGVLNSKSWKAAYSLAFDIAMLKGESSALDGDSFKLKLNFPKPDDVNYAALKSLILMANEKHVEIDQKASANLMVGISQIKGRFGGSGDSRIREILRMLKENKIQARAYAQKVKQEVEWSKLGKAPGDSEGVAAIKEIATNIKAIEAKAVEAQAKGNFSELGHLETELRKEADKVTLQIEKKFKPENNSAAEECRALQTCVNAIQRTTNHLAVPNSDQATRITKHFESFLHQEKQNPDGTKTKQVGELRSKVESYVKAFAELDEKLAKIEAVSNKFGDMSQAKTPQELTDIHGEIVALIGEVSSATDQSVYALKQSEALLSCLEGLQNRIDKEIKILKSAGPEDNPQKAALETLLSEVENTIETVQEKVNNLTDIVKPGSRLVAEADSSVELEVAESETPQGSIQDDAKLIDFQTAIKNTIAAVPEEKLDPTLSAIQKQQVAEARAAFAEAKAAIEILTADVSKMINSQNAEKFVGHDTLDEATRLLGDSKQKLESIRDSTNVSVSPDMKAEAKEKLLKIASLQTELNATKDKAQNIQQLKDAVVAAEATIPSAPPLPDASVGAGEKITNSPDFISRGLEVFKAKLTEGNDERGLNYAVLDKLQKTLTSVTKTHDQTTKLTEYTDKYKSIDKRQPEPIITTSLSSRSGGGRPS